MQLVFILEQVLNGLLAGSSYLLIALGLSLIFSLGGIVNLAHGAFYAIGAYLAIEIGKAARLCPAHSSSRPFSWVCLASCVERYLFRRFYRADPILSLLVTFGLAMVVEQLLRILWGAAPDPLLHT